MCKHQGGRNECNALVLAHKCAGCSLPHAPNDRRVCVALPQLGAPSPPKCLDPRTPNDLRVCAGCCGSRPNPVLTLVALYGRHRVQAALVLTHPTLRALPDSGRLWGTGGRRPSGFSSGNWWVKEQAPLQVTRSVARRRHEGGANRSLCRATREGIRPFYPRDRLRRALRAQVVATQRARFALSGHARREQVCACRSLSERPHKFVNF